MLTCGIPPDFRDGVQFIKNRLYAIGSVPNLSCHAIAFWRSLPGVRRHRASKPQGSSSHGCCLCRSPCVCECFLPIHSGHQVRWTYQPGLHRRKVTQDFSSTGYTGGRSRRISHPPSFCGACLNFSREKDSAIPFPRRPPWTN